MEIVIKEHTFLNLGFDNNPANIIDLGACTGEFIGGFIEKFGSYGNFVLVEANPTNIEKMPDFIKDNFRVINAYASSSDYGTQRFLEDPNSPYNGTSVFNHFKDGIEHDIQKISVNKIRNMSNMEIVDILKIDIEGGEYDLLDKMEKSDFDGIKQITVEFHDFLDVSFREATKELVKKIEGFGYNSKANGTNYMCGSDYYDVLFYK